GRVRDDRAADPRPAGRAFAPTGLTSRGHDSERGADPGVLPRLWAARSVSVRRRPDREGRAQAVRAAARALSGRTGVRRRLARRARARRRGARGATATSLPGAVRL